jgi:ligand-binding sensor domain-containing protein
MVTALAVDGRDRVWAGTTEGLVCFAEDESRLLTTDNSALPSNTIDALAADRQGRLWIGTDKGVTTYAHSTTREVEKLTKR